MARIYLNETIFNGFGTVDEVLSKINAVPDNEPLELQVNSGGGICSDGRVLYQAILERKGETTFIGVGIVASMAAVLMAAFDKVKLESSCDIMFHKGRPAWWEYEDEVSDEEQYLVDRFNDLAYNDLSNKGVDEGFLNEVFNSEGNKDHWITAQRAEEIGLGQVFKTIRKNNMPVEVLNAVKGLDEMDSEKKKEAYYMAQAEAHGKQMLSQANKPTKFKIKSMFTGKKLMRSVKLANGTEACFMSKSETPAKGDVLTPIGSAKALDGKIALENNTMLTVSNNEVIDAEEMDTSKDTVTREEFDAALARIKALEDKGTDAGDNKDGAADAKPDAKSDDAPKVNDNVTDIQGMQTDISNLAKVVDALSKVAGNNFTPPTKVSNITEPDGTPLSGQSAYLKSLDDARVAGTKIINNL